MDPHSADQRLSRITTLWTLLHQAHASPLDEATKAQRLLMERYHGAIYRYLRGALRDEEAAGDLFQEFALRFLRGDFRRADERRGRFRDYVKTALIHLVTDHHRARRDQPRPLPADVAGPAGAAEPADADAAFLTSWREELLSRTWEALKQAHAVYHAVLLSYVQQPQLTAAERAEQLTASLGRTLSASHLRVAIHRAREKFADLLLEEVEHSLERPTPEALTEELRELQLLALCAPALERKGHRASGEQSSP